MIVRRNFQPWKILPYAWKEIAFTGALAFALIQWGDARAALPFGPLGVVGTALAIFLGFRGNTGYARWTEARALWAGVTHQSRVLARIIVSSTGNALQSNKGGAPEKVLGFRREIVHRQIAFAHALRHHLRGGDELREVAQLLPAAEAERLRAAQNKPNQILQWQSNRVRDGVREECLGPFDPISLEPCLAALNNFQAACERIKQTPVPRQYDFFTRLFLWLFLALLPSSLLGLFPPGSARWALLPLALVVAFVYAISSKVGRLNDEPFADTVHDVPMTAICNGIERDLREQLGETELPAPAAPARGYLR